MSAHPALVHAGDLPAPNLAWSAEEALRQSEERYRQLFENALTGNGVSAADGRILACNPSFARIFGFASVEEALRANMNALYASQEARAALLRQLRKHGRVTAEEAEMRRRDGKPVHVVRTVVGTFDEHGELTQVQGFVFDNTERKRLEEQLRQAQKLEAVGRLAGGVAHDFNNLLTVINGCSELLLEGLAPDDANRELVREVRKAGERAAALTRQLLAYSRKQVLAPVVLDLNALVAGMEKLLSRLLGEDVVLTLASDPALGRVRADPGQLEQVLMNLAVNARDAMPRGGELTVETRNVFLDEARPHAPSGPYVLLAVRDTGCGMTEAVRARLFEPFFTTKEKGKGTGLGLAVVHGIVTQSEGFLEVDSRPGRGSTFRIYLPRLDGPAATLGSQPGLAQAPRGRETVLLVEDEEGVRALGRLVLQQAGYTVVEARSGPEALERCARHGGPVHLLATDVVMPGMSGRELADHLRPQRPGLKVLYLSGYTDDAIFRHGVSAAGAAFLSKPFTASVLTRKVREVLDGP